MIETDRLLLRQPRPDDAPAFAKMLRDAEVMHFIGGVTDEPAEGVVDRWRERWLANGVGPFVIVRRHWGRGYATEGALAVREWAWREAGVTGLISLIHPDNGASRRVAERLGCVRRERVRLDTGVHCDIWVHPPPNHPEGQEPAR